jgi:hypothetical protein
LGIVIVNPDLVAPGSAVVSRMASSNINSFALCAHFGSPYSDLKQIELFGTVQGHEALASAQRTRSNRQAPK